MPKKIYDIKPPRMAQVEENIPEIKVVKRKRKKRADNSKNRKIIWRFISISILVVLSVVAIYLFFKLPKAQIIIWPNVDTLSFTQTIKADKAVSFVDIENSTIPAYFFQASKTNSQDFPATGSASDGGLASGTITIYNKFDPPSPLTLRAGTHFMSDSGKIFVAPQRIVVPAAKKSSGKIIPGTIQVTIQAVEMGSDYNIPPSNFSIPGLKGTSYYYSITASSEEGMTGGFSGKVKKVTSDDIQGAKDVLTQKTEDDAISAIKSQISSDYILSEEAMSLEVINASTETKANAIVDTFNYEVSVMVRAVAFKKSDIEQFAKDYIISQAQEGKTLLDNSFKVDYWVKTVDILEGKVNLNLIFSSGVYQEVNKNSIALSVVKQNASQINTTIDRSLGEQISKVRVNFWPFWVRSAPSNLRRISVDLKFE